MMYQLFLQFANLTEVFSDSEWRKAYRGNFNFDLEHEELQVLVNGTNGFGDRIQLAFYTNYVNYIGGVVIFVDSWSYYIFICAAGGDMEEDSRQDMESDQIWTFKMDRDLNNDHIFKAYCNGKLAVEQIISGDTCDEFFWSGSYWTYDITQVGFEGDDTASDFYRHKPEAVDTGINAKLQKIC